MASVIPQSLLKKLESVYIANARGSQGRAMTGAAYLGGSIGGAYLGGYRTKGSKNKTQSEYSKFIKENYEWVKNQLKDDYKGKALNIAILTTIADAWNEQKGIKKYQKENEDLLGMDVEGLTANRAGDFLEGNGALGGYRTKGSKNKVPSEYSLFLKEHYHDVRNDLSRYYSGKELNKQTLRRLAAVWKGLKE